MKCFGMVHLTLVSLSLIVFIFNIYLNASLPVNFRSLDLCVLLQFFPQFVERRMHGGRGSLLPWLRFDHSMHHYLLSRFFLLMPLFDHALLSIHKYLSSCQVFFFFIIIIHLPVIAWKSTHQHQLGVNKQWRQRHKKWQQRRKIAQSIFVF